jgi:hypothetical protein
VSAPRVVAELPPLGLAVELVSAEGARRRLADDEPSATDRPQGRTFATKRGEGFSTGNATLARRVDQDWPDLGLFDGVAFVGRGAHGRDLVAWEGRLARPPRSFSDHGHSIAIEAIGWAAHLRDRKMSMVYADRAISGWGQTSVRVRAGHLSNAGWKVVDPTSGNGPSARPTLRLELAGTWTPRALCEALYDAGPGNRVARIYGEWARGEGRSTAPKETIDPNDVAWNWEIGTMSDDGGAGRSTSGDLSTQAGPSAALRTFTAQRYAWAWLYYNAAGGIADLSYPLDWRDLCVYGDHGLPLIGDNPPGVAASDVRRHIIQTWCPQLRPDGITATDYPIRHLVFRDRVHPYDALLEVGKFDLHELAVWEDRTVHTWPADLSDFDWEVRLDDPGVRVELQGDSTDQLANGVEVEFDDPLTGRRELLLPADFADLRDDDVEHPANRHGLQVHTTLQLSSPAVRSDALQIGRMFLAEFNRPQAPGQITCTGYVRDRAGNPQPAWRPRAADRIAITSSTALSDRPRLIGETNYRHGDQGQPGAVTLTIEQPPRTVEALQDRIATALQAEGLL